MSESKRHHYLSQCYLKGFTKESTKDSKLCGIEIETRKFFWTKPLNVAVEQNFNRIEQKGVSPNHIESNLAQFETDISQAIRNIEQVYKFEGTDKTTILAMIALFATRNPNRRDYRTWTADYLYKHILLMHASANVGNIVNGKEITPEYVDFLKAGEFKISYTQNSQIRFELEEAEFLLSLLKQRKWILAVAPDNTNLITSDNPVVLIWKDANKQMTPGFRISNTLVLFSLTKKLLLIGDFEGDNAVKIGTKEIIAEANHNILFMATRQIYTPEKNFILMTDKGDITFWEELDRISDSLSNV